MGIRINKYISSPIWNLVVKNRQQDGWPVAVAVLLVDLLAEEDGRAVVPGEHRRYFFLRLGGYALAQAAKKENLYCELYGIEYLHTHTHTHTHKSIVRVWSMAVTSSCASGGTRWRKL